MKTVKLGDVVALNPRDPKPSVATEVSFVGMAQLDAMSATASPLDNRPFSDVSSDYAVFRESDILAQRCAMLG